MLRTIIMVWAVLFLMVSVSHPKAVVVKGPDGDITLTLPDQASPRAREAVNKQNPGGGKPSQEAGPLLVSNLEKITTTADHKQMTQRFWVFGEIDGWWQWMGALFAGDFSRDTRFAYTYLGNNWWYLDGEVYGTPVPKRPVPVILVMSQDQDPSWQITLTYDGGKTLTFSPPPVAGTYFIYEDGSLYQ